MLYCNNTEPDTRMAKNQEDFRRFYSAGTAMDKIVNVTTQCMSSSGFGMMYRCSQHNWYVYSDGKEIFITLKSLPCHVLYGK